MSSRLRSRHLRDHGQPQPWTSGDHNDKRQAMMGDLRPDGTPVQVDVAGTASVEQVVIRNG
jgi:hypothetical protein